MGLGQYMGPLEPNSVPLSWTRDCWDLLGTVLSVTVLGTNEWEVILQDDAGLTELAVGTLLFVLSSK